MQAEWPEGTVLLDTYRVDGVLGQGGMARVYKVRHLGWGMDLALKTPLARIFESPTGKSLFVGEAETWVNLSLHPHVVACHYVRNIEDVPRIFAEYVDGGSLLDWMRCKRLYAPDRKAAVARILDVAIQSAWGLHHAHKEGVVHQDVKPANILLSNDGVALVTDFGLANARLLAERATRGPGGRRKPRPMTPAFCSPEQAEGRELSRRTDIWSWGLSVLQMFSRDLAWKHGQLAPQALEAFRKHATESGPMPSMPDELADLLARCFAVDPAARPATMRAVADETRAIHEACCGAAHPRPEPVSAALLADGINNRAVSLLDLGRSQEAGRMMDEAVVTDPRHPFGVYNRGLLRWRAGKLTDDVVLRALDACASGGWEEPYLAGWVHVERRDSVGARQAFAKALEVAGPDASARSVIEQALEEVPAGIRPLRSLDTNAGCAPRLAITPDATWAAVASGDGAVHVWNLREGRRVRECSVASQPVTAIALTRDGRRLAAAEGERITVWDLRAGERQRILHSGSGAVAALAFAGSRRLASAGADQTVRLWEIESSTQVAALKGHAGAIHALGVTADGRLALSAGSDAVVRLWRLVGEPGGEAVLRGPTAIINAVAIDAEGRRALSAGWDRRLYVWDLGRRECRYALEGNTGVVDAVALSNDGRIGLTGARDGTLRIWELEQRRCLRSLRPHGDGAIDAALAGDGRTAVSLGGDGRLRSWEIETTGPRAPHLVVRPRPSAMVLSRYRRVRRLLDDARTECDREKWDASLDGVARARAIPGYHRHPECLGLLGEVARHTARCGLASAWPGSEIEVHPFAVHAVAPVGRGGLVATASGDLTLGVWDPFHGERKARLEGHTGPVTGVDVAADGDVAVSASFDGTLRLWELEAGRCTAVLDTKTGPWHDVAISSNGTICVAGGAAGTLSAWDLRAGRSIRSLRGHRGAIRAVDLTPGGHLALSAGNDGTLRLWDLLANGCRRNVRAHRREIHDCALSGDGRLGVTACADGTAAVWDLVTGQRLHVLEGHESGVRAVCLTADARYALTGGEDGTLRIWELLSGTCLTSLTGHRSGILAVSLTAEGHHAHTAGEGGILRSWQLDWSLEARDPREWDEGARRCIETVLGAHALSREGASPQHWLARHGEKLRLALEDWGFGWLDGELVQARLGEMLAESPAGEEKERPSPVAPIRLVAPADLTGGDLLELRETVLASLDRSKGALLLDLSRVRFADPAALAFLEEVRDRLSRHDAELIVCAPSNEARRLLAGRGLGRAFPSAVEARWFLPGSAGEAWVPWRRAVG